MKFLKSENFFVLFFSFVLLTLSFSSTVYEGFRGQNLGDARRVFLWGEHNFTYDYNVYLAKMREGAEGAWTVTNKYTSESHQGVFLQEFYLLSGKVGGWLGLEPPATYFLLRFGLAIIFVLAIYALILFFVKDSATRKIAFLLALFSGGWPKFLFYEGSWHAVVRFDWWQEMDQIKRASYVPHYLLGHILTIISLLFLIKSQNKRSYFVLAILSGAVAGFVHPPSLLIVWGIWGISFLFSVVGSRFSAFRHLSSVFSLQSPVVRLLAFIFLTSLPLLYVNQAIAVYPWKSLVDYDVAHPWIYSLTEYILALGVTLPLAFLGIVFCKDRKKEELHPLLFWLLVVPLGMISLKVTGSHSELYFIQVAVHLPLAIFSALFIIKVGNWLKKKTKLNFVPLLLALVLLFSLPGIYASLHGQFQFINQRANAVMPLVPYPSQVMYPLRDWWGAVMWLKNNTPNKSIVLSEHTAGNYIPAYAGNTVYLGHVAETVNFTAKKANVDYFFKGGMDPATAQKFLVGNNISYVFYDPQAQEQGTFPVSNYPFLKPVYMSTYVTIYKVTN
ncbi:MAG: hypothetical protein Q8Q24_00770 [bacterium]|nr:hypothetical protein [bacterium]